MAIAQAGSAQFDAVRAMHDTIEDGVADRRIIEHLVMPWTLTGASLRSGSLIRTIRSMAAVFWSVIVGQGAGLI